MGVGKMRCKIDTILSIPHGRVDQVSYCRALKISVDQKKVPETGSVVPNFLSQFVCQKFEPYHSKAYIYAGSVGPFIKQYP